MKPRKAFSLLSTLRSPHLIHQRPLERQLHVHRSSALPKNAPSRSQTRTLIAPPLPNSGPLMTRRSDRALPSLKPSWRIWVRTLPIFALIITVSSLGIFNYQKSSSPVVSSTLYALRRNEAARRELGDEIYFRDMIPWIWGELNQLHGRVNIRFGVKGTRGRGVMRFKSERQGRMGKFETKEWSLQTEDGRMIELLDSGSRDPFAKTMLTEESA